MGCLASIICDIMRNMNSFRYILSRLDAVPINVTWMLQNIVEAFAAAYAISPGLRGGAVCES